MSKRPPSRPANSSSTKRGTPSPTTKIEITDSPIGDLIVDWRSPGRLLAALQLLFRAGLFSILALFAGILISVVVDEPKAASNVVVVLWFIILIKFVPPVCRRLFFRAQRRVAVHEEGIVIDHESIPWRVIKSAYYHKHLHHLNKSKIALHIWIFKLKDREDIKVTSLNDYLGAHIDAEKLNALLTASLEDFRRSDDPVIVDQDPRGER